MMNAQVVVMETHPMLFVVMATWLVYNILLLPTCLSYSDWDDRDQYHYETHYEVNKENITLEVPSLKKRQIKRVRNFFLMSDWTGREANRALKISFLFNMLFITMMGESSKFPKSWALEIQIFKLAGYLQKIIIQCLNG